MTASTRFVASPGARRRPTRHAAGPVVVLPQADQCAPARRVASPATTDVVVLVPRRHGKPDRDDLWRFARAVWEHDHPTWPVFEGYHDAGPFNRSAAINQAARSAGRNWRVALIIDADVICDPHAVDLAVDVARTGTLVIAGDERIHLSQAGTDLVIGGYRGSWRTPQMAEQVYAQHWSSCVAVSHALWDEVHGFDETFEGWGYEDDAFRWACETMSDRPLVKVSAPIWHLWHATQTVTAPGRAANRARADQYLAARWDRSAMRALIDETL